MSSYIALDMEWNQYHLPEKPPVSPEGRTLKEEIIQIGAVKLNENFDIVDTLKQNVRLPDNRKLNKHLVKLLNYTREDSLNGVDFASAYARLVEWMGSPNAIFVWGEDDRHVMRTNAEFYGITMFEVDWINLRKLYIAQFPNPDGKSSLQTAVERMGVEPLSYHDAFNDAYMTALMCKKLDMTANMSDYALPAAARAPRKKPMGIWTWMTPFYATVDEARAAMRRLKFLCPKCLEPLKPRDPENPEPPSRGTKQYICDSHGTYGLRVTEQRNRLGRVRLRAALVKRKNTESNRQNSSERR